MDQTLFALLLLGANPLVLFSYMDKDLVFSSASSDVFLHDTWWFSLGQGIATLWGDFTTILVFKAQHSETLIGPTLISPFLHTNPSDSFYSLCSMATNIASSDMWDMMMCSLFKYASSGPIPCCKVRQHILEVCHLLDLKVVTQPSPGRSLCLWICMCWLICFILVGLFTREQNMSCHLLGL